MDQEIVEEFLIESYEILNALDNDLVALERESSDPELLNRIFRGVHTIKGTSGFLSFSKLVTITHVGEGLLDRLRKGSLAPSEEITSTLLKLIDAIREILVSIETTGEEGDEDYANLVATLKQLEQRDGTAEEVDEVDEDPSPAVSPGDAPCAAEYPESVSSLHGGDGSATPVLADNNIRVDVELLDKLMNLVGELVLTRNQILQFASEQKDTSFASSSQQLNLITTELQEGVMKTRMQPIKNVWSKFPRVVRDVAVACSKEARVEMEGADTELDKTIIEAIKDPLTHLVRNAVDHGIEKPEKRAACGKPAEGRLLLRAFHEGGQVNIEIIDDGAGIDPEHIKQRALKSGLVMQNDLAEMSDREVLNLIFLPGFSTADQVNDISGRGVGMDVVKTNIEKIGGTVDVHSQRGEGTTFKIKIPLTLAIIPALIIHAGDERFAIPQVNVLELVHLEGEQVHEDIERINNTPVYRLRGTLLPLVYLGETLQVKGRSLVASSDRESISIVVLQADDQNFGLVVDEVIDTEEVVVKPLSKHIKDLSTYAGATIMGDGKVALILDVLGLADRARVLSEDAGAQSGTDTETQEQQDRHNQQMLLLLRVGQRRQAIPRAVISRLEEVPPEQVEQVGPREMVQYRGRLLPLVHLGRAFGDGPETPTEESRPLQVVVCTLDETRVGLVVDEIVDVVEEHVELERFDATDGIAGLAVLQERITEVIDVPELIAAAGLVRTEANDTVTTAA